MSSTATDSNISTALSDFIQRRMRNVHDPVRSHALDVFRQIGLPAAKHEEYKHTPVTRMLEKNFTFQDVAVEPLIEDVSEYLIPGVEGNLLVFLNGVYNPSLSVVRTPASKMTIRNLEEALEEKNVLAVEHFNRHVSTKADGLIAWNTADWNSGLFIHIPDNVVVEEPVLFLYVNDATAGEVIATNRNLLVVGKNSSLTMIEKFNSVGGRAHFTNHVNEVVVAENAHLEYYSINNDKGNRYQFSQTEIYQRNTSRVNSYTFDLDGQLLRTNLHLIIDGEGIESHMYGLYLLKGNTLADNHTVVDHKRPHSLTNELYKGVLDDNAKGVFNGKIYVRPQAQKTNAFQANRNILLSEKASINTKPQLEIWADDVKCSHGCTSGQLDEEALFYLRTRGIDKHTARAMMLYAFAAEVTEKMPNEAIRTYMEKVISERLQKP